MTTQLRVALLIPALVLVRGACAQHIPEPNEALESAHRRLAVYLDHPGTAGDVAPPGAWNDATLKVLKAVLNVPSVELSSSAVRTTAHGQCVFSKWRLPNGSVLVEDSPDRMYLLLRVGTGSNPDVVSTFVADGPFWHHPPVTIRWLSEPEKGRFVGRFEFPHISAQFPEEFQVLFSGQVTNAQLEMVIDLRHGFSGVFFPVQPFMAERFPPLSELITQWSTQQLLADLRQRTPQGRPSHRYRQEQIVSELAKRDLAYADVKTMFTTLAERETYAEFVYVKDVERTGKADNLERYLPQLMAEICCALPGAYRIVEDLAIFANSHCSSDSLEAMRIATERAVLSFRVLQFFKTCGDAQSVTLLERAKTPQGLITQRDELINKLRGRTGSRNAADGKPVR